MKKCSHVSVYTDGSCATNPGPGGYAAIIKKGGFYREIVGGVQHSTNNRMEMMAIIQGLNQVKPRSSVIVYTDSGYVERAVNEGRVSQWESNGWKRIRTLEPVKNADLWKVLLSIIQSRNLDVKFQKIAAHKGDRFNERVDFLARRAAKAA